MTEVLTDSVLHTRLRAASRQLFWFGLAMTFVGVIAIVFSMVSTFAATLFVGWMLLLAGLFLFVGSFAIHGTSPFFGGLLMALLMVAAGVFLLFNPLAGVLALTILLGVLFLVQGAFELALAFEMRPQRTWVWMLLSGLASVVLAVVIAAGLPGISLIALGILLGVNFLSTGLGYIFASQAAV